MLYHVSGNTLHGQLLIPATNIGFRLYIAQSSETAMSIVRSDLGIASDADAGSSLAVPMSDRPTLCPGFR